MKLAPGVLWMGERRKLTSNKVSNIRPEGQNCPSKDSNSTHWRALETRRTAWVWTSVFSRVLQLFLLITAIRTTPKHKDIFCEFMETLHFKCIITGQCEQWNLFCNFTGVSCSFTRPTRCMWLRCKVWYPCTAGCPLMCDNRTVLRLFIWSHSHLVAHRLTDINQCPILYLDISIKNKLLKSKDIHL